MAGWGEVLEAMHLAPRGVRTVRLTVEQAMGGDGAPTAPDGDGRPDDEGAGRIGISTTIVSSSSGSISFVGGSSTQEYGPFRSTLWFDTDGRRYRIDHGPSSVVFDGQRRWQPIGGGRIHVRDDDGADQQLPLLLVNPEVVLGWYSFTSIEPTSHLGRDATTLVGTRRRSTLMGPPLLDMVLPGLDVRAVIDAATGVLLSVHTANSSRPTARLDVVELAYDDFDPDDVLQFEPGPGATVLTTDDLRREAEAAGRLPMPHRMDLAAQTVLVGPPPDDPDAAEAAIRHAVEHLTDIDDDDRCPHIQGGENLADAIRESRRSPFVGEDGATFECGDITFVRADEAAVRFRVSVPRAPLGGIDTDGRALLLGGHWVVDRVTVCKLLSMAGVTCPPPPD